MLNFENERDKIVGIVSRFTGVEFEDIIHRDRHWYIMVPRHIAVTLFYKKYKSLGLSLKKAGEMFDGRDHTTIINSIRAVENLVVTDPDFKRVFNKIKEEVDNVERLSN